MRSKIVRTIALVLLMGLGSAPMAEAQTVTVNNESVQENQDEQNNQDIEDDQDTQDEQDSLSNDSEQKDDDKKDAQKDNDKQDNTEIKESKKKAVKKKTAKKSRNLFNGKIRRSAVTLRKGRSYSSKAITRIPRNKIVRVYGTYGKWRKVSYKNKIGYVPKQNVFISVKAPSLKGKSSKEKGKTVAKFAQRFKGNRYVYGKTDLNNGTDCSGFVRSVYKAFGYNLPRSSSEQRHAGRKVKKGNIQPGDVVCYSGHVAIYIGNGHIVHASTRRTGIKISSNYRYRRVLSIRRIVK